MPGPYRSSSMTSSGAGSGLREGGDGLVHHVQQVDEGGLVGVHKQHTCKDFAIGVGRFQHGQRGLAAGPVKLVSELAGAQVGPLVRLNVHDRTTNVAPHLIARAQQSDGGKSL